VNTGPHFLGIGAQKAGTTWLWAQLKRHPQIWMPVRKEVHYFSRHLISPTVSILALGGLRHKLLGREPASRLWRAMVRSDLTDAIRSRDVERVKWIIRYYASDATDDWYRSLFPPSPELICGEISPSYSILGEPEIAHVAKLFPKLRVILLLRNPIDRAWSQVRFDWTRGVRSEIEDTEGIKAFIDSPKQALRSDYLRILSIWSRHFPKEQIFVGFYDDIVSRPAEILERVHDFLGLERQPIDQGTLSKRVHVSREAAMPAEIRTYLIEKYLPSMRELSQRFGDPVTNWVNGVTQAESAGAVDRTV
jgi:hypothetical protein